METNKQEYLDLVSTLKIFKRGIVKSTNAVARFFNYIGQNILILLGWMALGLCIGLTLYYTTEPYYSSSLTLFHTRVHNEDVSQMISNLQSQIDGEDNNILAAELKISKHIARNVRHIQMRTVNEAIANRYKDSLRVLLPFNVFVFVYDPEILDTLQLAIVNYLESNVFAVKMKQIELDILKRTEDKLMSEMADIDSLKRVVTRAVVPRGNGNGIIFGEPLDPTIVYTKSLELFERRLFTLKKQQLNNSFEVIVPFGKPFRSSHKILFYIISCTFGGFIFGLIFLVAREQRNKPA
jgi:hypothetical protein